MLTRSNEDNKILVLNDSGQEEVLEEDKLLQSLNVDGIIRIPEDEFNNIDLSLDCFAHFNLECTNHTIGHKYALVKILRNGHFDNATNEQVLPLLSMYGFYTAECVGVENYIKYENLNDEYFKYSMKNIKNIYELKNIITKRYSKSMPDLSQQEIINLGVGYTLLKIIK